MKWLLVAIAIVLVTPKPVDNFRPPCYYTNAWCMVQEEVWYVR